MEYAEVITSSGVKIPFVPTIISPKIERPLRRNRYEARECEAVRRMLKPGDRVLELGAGVGLLSTIAGMVEGIDSVTTIEANPGLIPLIRETHRLNGVSHVTVINGVASAEDGPSVDFYLRPDFWGSSMESQSRPYDSVVALPRVGVGELVKSLRPTVLICDIEGGELG
ncbi:MAG: FkbM family methyltransferase, partial [Acetobacteraceae bacterium]